MSDIQKGMMKLTAAALVFLLAIAALDSCMSAAALIATMVVHMC